jgi:hypothetical protein
VQAELSKEIRHTRSDLNFLSATSIIKPLFAQIKLDIIIFLFQVNVWKVFPAQAADISPLLRKGVLLSDK